MGGRKRAEVRVGCDEDSQPHWAVEFEGILAWEPEGAWDLNPVRTELIYSEGAANEIAATFNRGVRKRDGFVLIGAQDDPSVDWRAWLQFDATGMGHWWGFMVGRVLVWSHSATDGPMSPDQWQTIRGMVCYGAVQVQEDSVDEFYKALPGFLQGKSDFEDYYALIGRPKVAR